MTTGDQTNDQQAYAAYYAQQQAAPTKVELSHSVGTIAVGVFFGNAVTAFIAWIIWMIASAAS